MSAVFNHAVRWEWLDVSAIRMVRESAKRTRMPIVLSIEQIAALLRILKEPARRMVFLAVFAGLRVGELLGLQWKDIDFQKMEVHIIRWNSRTNGSLMASSGVTKSLCYELSACSSMA